MLQVLKKKMNKQKKRMFQKSEDVKAEENMSLCASFKAQHCIHSYVILPPALYVPN